MNLTYDMKKSLLVILILLAFIPSFSFAAKDAVRITDPEGKYIIVKLEENPKLYYADNSIVLSSKKGDLFFSIDSKVKVELIDSGDTKIEPIGGEILSPRVNFYGNEIVVSNTGPGSQILVFDAEGKKRISGIADSEGVARIDISFLQPGVYLISLDGFSFKFIKK